MGAAPTTRAASLLSLANASILTVTGAEAEQMMIAMWKDEKTVVIMNTIETTVIQNGSTECTLLGSHGGSARTADTIFSCQITQ